MAMMQARMLASAAPPQQGDAKAGAQSREVREEGGAQGEWETEEGMQHSRMVRSPPARNVASHIHCARPPSQMAIFRQDCLRPPQHALRTSGHPP